MNLLTKFERFAKNKPLILLISFTFIGIIGFVDFITGYEFAISVFYVLPIAVMTWLTNLHLGLTASLVCALVWLGADVGAGHPYSHDFVPIWNAFIRGFFFVIITTLLSSLRAANDREKALSRIDNLTGAGNSRHFYNIVELEIIRFQKQPHPFTVAYIDLDNFKQVNDQFGHLEGDQVLCSVVESARKLLRKSDVVARLGGDEFALFLPETDENAAHISLTKVKNGLLAEMRKNNWPVTFSIGVLICHTPPTKVDELVKIADELMYSVKRDNKNDVKFSIYGD